MTKTPIQQGALHYSIGEWLNKRGFKFLCFDEERESERYSITQKNTGHIWFDYWGIEFLFKQYKIKLTHHKISHQSGKGYGLSMHLSLQDLVQQNWEVDRFFNMHMSNLVKSVERAMFNQLEKGEVNDTITRTASTPY